MYQTVSSPADFDPDRYAREGVAAFKGFLAGDPALAAYRDDLTWMARTLLTEYGDTDLTGELDTLLLRVFRHDNLATMHLCHLGTQPSKIVSANALKFGPRLTELARRILGDGAVLGTTQSSDTLHMIFSEPGFERYLLPPHQDYPAHLQSPRLLTFWIPLSPWVEHIGGMYVWPGSHALGPSMTRKDANNNYQTVISDADLEHFPRVRLEWDLGDLIAFDGHLIHQALPNATGNRLRVTQLFRYTDLTDPKAIEMRWRSVVHPRKSLDFGEVYPHLVQQP